MTEPRPSALIAETFNTYFRRWDITIAPDDVTAGKKGSLGKKGWGIRYVVDLDDHGELFLEFYATHRMTNSRHVLIKSSGASEHLEAIETSYAFDPNVGGSEDRAAKENLERNRRVAEDLKARGLFPDGDINTFIGVGGMQASDAIKEMAGLLAEAQLPLPLLPPELRSGIHRVRKWCYATREVDPLDMYRFNTYLVEAVAGEPEPYFAFSHAGHGINSYAINYQLVIGRLALFLQVPWGGVYGDSKLTADVLNGMFDSSAQVLELITHLPPGRRLLVADSALRNARICGWIPDGLDEDAAGAWLRSDHLSVEDPFVQAERILEQELSRERFVWRPEDVTIVKRSKPKTGFYLLFIDGAKQMNPNGEPEGEGSIGVVLKDPKGVQIAEKSARIGPVPDPHVAEYQALLHGLELAQSKDIEYIAVFSDSRTLVNQVNKIWKHHTDHLKDLCDQALFQLSEFKGTQISWIPRGWNGEADGLAGEAQGTG